MPCRRRGREGGRGSRGEVRGEVRWEWSATTSHYSSSVNVLLSEFKSEGTLGFLITPVLGFTCTGVHL